jgi:hypothetical protein
MQAYGATLRLGILVAGLSVVGVGMVFTQEPLPPNPVPAAGVIPPLQTPPSSAANALPQSPQGVEVLTRGPVHEAFATPTTEPTPTKLVDRQPPQPLQEMPPAEKPEGNAVWIAGYWAYDDDRKDYLWVSGTWRTPPPGKQWVAGYWKNEGNQSRWVPGFWNVTDNQPNGTHAVNYMPAPPAAPNVAPPGEPPTPDSFFVPGHWAWHNAGPVVVNGAQVYQDAGYSWTAGYWARVQPGYVWVASHYRWTPSGFVFIPGYWDLAVAHRGFLYAPVYVNASVTGPGFVYTPAYAVPHTVVIDAFWVRPSHCHYYFGDYYGPVYAGYGFESCAIYSRRYYDPIFTYAVYEHRAEPRWGAIQVDICLGRAAGRYPCPPRTMVEQIRIGYRGPTVVVAARIGEVSGVRTVRLAEHERVAAAHHAAELHKVAMERQVHENRMEGPRAAPHGAAFRAPAPPAGAKAAAAHAAPPHPATKEKSKQTEHGR